MTSERSLETLTAGDFRDHLGTPFRLTGVSTVGGGPAVSVVAELADVSENPPGPPSATRAPFSVVFRGPLEPFLPQGIHHVEHEHFGTLELFIVPIGPDEPSAQGEAPTAMRYEAVFG